MPTAIDAGWVDLEEGARQPPRAQQQSTPHYVPPTLLAFVDGHSAFCFHHPEAASAAAAILGCCGLLWLLA